MIDKHLDFARLCHPERSAVRRAVEGSREGFTLVELLVYIAIVGIVVIVAGQAFSNSTKMRVRTQSMLKASEVAENVASLFKEDVAQTGAKSSMEAGTAVGGNAFSAVNNNVYMNLAADDSSSFSVNTAGGLSNLRVRRMRYDENGYYQAVEEINWFVQNEILKRSCLTIDGTAGTGCAPKNTGTSEMAPYTVEMASGVSTFIVTPALPSVSGTAQAQVFPPCVTGGACAEGFRLIARTAEADFSGVTITPTADGKTVTLSGFSTNYKMNENDENKAGRLLNQVFVAENAGEIQSSWKNCYKITLVPRQEYEIAFSLSDAGSMSEKMRLFVPGRDYMSVGFRLADNGSQPMDLDDFLFFPPADKDASGVRRMRFSVSKTIQNVCMAFSFASYSPLAANGSLTISDVSLKKVESSNYTFDDAAVLASADKKNVKAMRLVLGIKQNGEEGRSSLVIPMPSNGPSD